MEKRRCSKGEVWKKMKEILQNTEQLPTYKQYREECIRAGINYKSFRYNYNRHIGKDFRIRTSEKGVRLIELIKKGEKADIKEIRILLDEITKKGNKETQRLALEEFWKLCKHKIVTHHPRIRAFFTETIGNKKYDDLQLQFWLLISLKSAIERSIKVGNNDIAHRLYNDNKEIIKKYAKLELYRNSIWDGEKMGRESIVLAPLLRKTALLLWALYPDKELLNILYEMIADGTIMTKEYNKFEEEIIKILKKDFVSEKLNIKEKLYAMAKHKDPKIAKRALKILSALN